MKTKTETNQAETGARAQWKTNSHAGARKPNFMGHLCAVRAGLALHRAEIIRSGFQSVRRGGCDVCLQP
jgi:hypothetical protein